MVKVKSKGEKERISILFKLWKRAVDFYTGAEARENRERRLESNLKNALEKRRKRGIPDYIEGYRQKFKNGPVGRWNNPGGYGPGPSDEWEFYPDGTGKIFGYSGMGSLIEIFEWKSVADWTIQIFVTQWLEVPPNDGPPVVVDDEDGAGWGCAEIQFGFKTEEYYGPTIVMFAVPEDMDLKFYWTMHYLRFDGDIVDEELAS